MVLRRHAGDVDSGTVPNRHHATQHPLVCNSLSTYESSALRQTTNDMATMTTSKLTFLKRLRLLGTVEGASTLILFGVAMPLKYFAGIPMAVRVAGSVHGFLFVCLVVMFALAVKKVPLARGLAVAGIIAAVFPFGPFVFDRQLANIAESDS